MSYKRLLLISHNALGKTNNMARTLETTFHGWPADCIAQLYFSDEEPNSEYCTRFFRISDGAMVKSIFTRKAAGNPVLSCQGRVYPAPAKISKFKSFIIKRARYRTPLIYCTRNAIWSIGEWYSKKLEQWIKEFKPEVVFYASGDYAFSYKIALSIARKHGIPLVIGCYDDFYLNRKCSVNPLYLINRSILMMWANRCFDYCNGFIGVCDSMTFAYEKLFRKRGITVYTSTDFKPKANIQKGKRIVYTGNLGYGRAEQLIHIGKALKDLSLKDYPVIEVYSGEIRTEITKQLNEENGLRFHGSVSAAEVRNLISASTLIIHTESFKPGYERRVRYSISTKIADYLASGTCIFAYGPKSVASMQYLYDNGAAYTVFQQEKLKDDLLRALSDTDRNREIITRALHLAKINHNASCNEALINGIVSGDFLNESITG